MTEPKILAEDEKRRLVELEATHEIDHDGSLSILYTASITQAGTTLRRISSAEEPTSFYLDFNVMEALCTAWEDFKNAQEAQKQAEAERKTQAIAEAHAIVARHPEIKIKKGDSCWEVSIPSQAYHFISPAYYPEQVLAQVKICRAVLAGQSDTMTGGDAA